MTVKEAELGPGRSFPAHLPSPPRAVAVPVLQPRGWGSRWHQVAAAPRGWSPARSASAPSPPPCSEAAGRSGDRSGAWRRRCHHSPSLPARGSRREGHGGSTDRESPATPVPCPPSRPFIPSWQRRNSKQGSKLNSITIGLTQTGSTALANISKVPCNSSLLFSSFVCFSLKRQLGHFKSQLSLYSSTHNCLVPTQSSADGPIPAAVQAPAGSWEPCSSGGRDVWALGSLSCCPGSPGASLCTVH